MNAVLVWDTETSGIPLFHEPSEDPRQPHIVQLAASLVDVDSHDTLASINLVARPDGWSIPDDVASIHGITTDLASQIGIPERELISLFLALGAGHEHVAHNSSFDERILRIALKRFFGDGAAEEFKLRTFHCTQRLSTPILNLPPTAKMLAAGRKHAKSPNLGEAYEFFTGRKLENAHNASVDVAACKAVYLAIKSGQREAAKVAA